MQVEGPRALRIEEAPALGRLLNACFRTSLPGDMLQQFPHVVHPENLANLLVVLEDGELVSHAGYVPRWMTFEGVALKLALVGAVATAEASRGRGHATRILNALLAQADRDGCDLAWISGGRGLYTTRGAAPVGRMWKLTVPAAAPSAVAGHSSGPSLAELSPADIPALSALYRREPVRFLRPPQDWAFAFQSRWIMNYYSRFWGVRRGGELTAYLILHEPRPNRAALLAEFAGDRADLAWALARVLAEMKIAAAEAHVADTDLAGLAALGPLAAEKRLGAASGTILPLGMARCLRRLRPRIAERCGIGIAAQFQVRETGFGPAIPEGRDDRLQITQNGETVEIAGRAAFARLLFGAPEADTASLLPAALRPAFPLPSPWYGANFV